MNVQARAIHDNPSPEELRAFTEQMPQARVTEFDNVNVQTRVTSRSADSTYVVAERSSGKTIFAIPYQGDFTLIGTTDQRFPRRSAARSRRRRRSAISVAPRRAYFRAAVDAGPRGLPLPACARSTTTAPQARRT